MPVTLSLNPMSTLVNASYRNVSNLHYCALDPPPSLLLSPRHITCTTIVPPAPKLNPPAGFDLVGTGPTTSTTFSLELCSCVVSEDQGHITLAGIIVCEPSGSDLCDPGTWLCVIDLWSSAFTRVWEQGAGVGLKVCKLCVILFPFLLFSHSLSFFLLLLIFLLSWSLSPSSSSSSLSCCCWVFAVVFAASGSDGGGFEVVVRVSGII